MKCKYTKENVKFMLAALELARKGEGSVFTNPMVGCVIAKDRRIIAAGYHKIFGGLHAEALALKKAGKRALGADMYVTLEPCNHSGKQPPCSQAIIKAGIKRVFCAQIDPNTNTRGKGVETLRKAGVEVFCGLLAKEARELNKDFIKHIASAKPRVAVKFAMSLDGKIAAKNYDSKWITSEKSRRLVHKLRSQYDGVLVGFNTVLKDNPQLTSHRQGKNPVRVIIDENLKLPRRHCQERKRRGNPAIIKHNKPYNVLDGRTPSVVVHSDKIKNYPPHFKKEGITLLPLDFVAFRKDFKILIQKLDDIGLKKILIEGGGETIASALAAKCANEVYAFVAPVIIGGRHAISPVEGEGAERVINALKIENMRFKKLGKDILIRGALCHCKQSKTKRRNLLAIERSVSDALMRSGKSSLPANTKRSREE